MKQRYLLPDGRLQERWLMPDLDASEDLEIVLPDGRFATVRPITVEDWLVMAAGGGLTAINLAALVARTCTVDGRDLDLQEVLAMRLDVYAPIAHVVNRELSRALRNQGVA